MNLQSPNPMHRRDTVQKHGILKDATLDAICETSLLLWYAVKPSSSNSRPESVPS